MQRQTLSVVLVVAAVVLAGLATGAVADVGSPVGQSQTDGNVTDGNETTTPDGNETTTPDGNETETPTGNETPTPGGNATTAVTFDNQTTDGTTVTVSSATIPEGGFVVIHNSTLFDGDAVGSVVGASGYFFPGTHGAISVTLDEPVEENETLVAMVHRDTNDNQMYDFVDSNGTDDGPYTDANGTPVTDTAMVTVEGDGPPVAGESLEVTDLAAADTVRSDEILSVTATVRNPNTETETGSVAYRLDGDVVDRTNVTLDGGMSSTVTFEVDLEDEELAPGTYVHGVFTDGDGQLAELNVSEEQSFAVEEITAPTNASAGETIAVNASVSNPNNETTTQPVEFRLDGRLVATRNVTLDAGANETVTFDVDTTDVEPGTYIHGVLTVDDGAFDTITVEESTGPEPTASVTFEDQEGNGTSAMVASASNDETPYYVAVWTQNESANESGTPEALLGSVQVTQTNVTNLSVEYTEPFNENATLIAAVHPDADGNASTLDPDTETILASDTANVTVAADGNVTPTPTPTGNETETPTGNETETPTGNETETPTGNETTTGNGTQT